MVEGATTMANGTQVIAIGVKDGYYNPNQFKAAAGSPIRVTFSGKTKGCLGMPEFKSLGKKGDFNTSGSATIELGTLPPGTYEFTCGMGMTGGKIVVQ
jgi:plastocyanin domain-containing protein